MGNKIDLTLCVCYKCIRRNIYLFMLFFFFLFFFLSFA